MRATDWPDRIVLSSREGVSVYSNAIKMQLQSILVSAHQDASRQQSESFHNPADIATEEDPVRTAYSKAATGTTHKTLMRGPVIKNRKRCIVCTQYLW